MAQETGTQAGTNKGARIAGIATLVACVALAVGVMLVFHACGPMDDGTWMSCHYAQLTVCGLASAAAVLSAVALALRNGVRMWLHVAVAVLAVVAAVVPGNVIHLCMMADMQCRAVMRPTVILFAVIIAACAVASALLERGRR